MTRVCDCGCGSPVADHKRFVHGHNARLVRVDAVERFNAKVTKGANDECWPWAGNRTSQGYGHFYLEHHEVKAHRYAWIIQCGEIPPGMHVLHRCDNPPCCNPAHLFLGTNADNVADKILKGRAVHPPHRIGADAASAKLTDDQANQVVSLVKGGWRQTDVALAYGVSQSTVSLIGSGKRWGHIGREHQ